jgi:hypothetical protein
MTILNQIPPQHSQPTRHMQLTISGYRIPSIYRWAAYQFFLFREIYLSCLHHSKESNTCSGDEPSESMQVKLLINKNSLPVYEYFYCPFSAFCVALFINCSKKGF